MQKCNSGVPTPIYTVRLPKITQNKLAEIAKAYGAPNGRAFVREVLEVITCGDMMRINAFGERFMTRLTGQLVLDLAESDRWKVQPQNGAAVPRKQAKAGKRRRRRARTT